FALDVFKRDEPLRLGNPLPQFDADARPGAALRLGTNRKRRRKPPPRRRRPEPEEARGPRRRRGKPPERAQQRAIGSCPQNVGENNPNWSTRFGKRSRPQRALAGETRLPGAGVADHSRQGALKANAPDLMACTMPPASNLSPAATLLAAALAFAV